jgi:DNA-binding NarL/FixJ family response regulator
MSPAICLIADGMEGDAVAAVSAITSNAPGTRVLLILDRAEGANVSTMLRAGAAGWLPRTINLDRLSIVLDAVLAGESIVPRPLIQQLVTEVRHGWSGRQMRMPDGRDVALTNREWAVLKLLAENHSTAQIAAILGTASGTVRSQIHLLRRKLDADPRAVAGRLLAPADVENMDAARDESA